MRHPRDRRCPRATTFRRILGLALALGGLPARADDTAEVELVRRTLEAPSVRASLDADALQRRAEATGPGVVADPTVGVRHEQANGPAGASTDIVGGSVTLDGLGAQRVVAASAAGIRDRAAPHWQEARRLDIVCALRADLTELDAALRAAVASRSGQERLDTLSATLSALADAGEASGYERDVAALARAQHHLEHIDAESRAAELRAGFVARAGLDVTSVALAPVGSPEGATHPELLALELEVQAADRDRNAAGLGALPDLTVEGGARWDAMPDGSQRAGGYEIGAQVQVPLFERNRRETVERSAASAAARAALERRRVELAAASAAASARVALLDAMPETPDPEPLWQAARVRYDAGESSLEELLQAAERVEGASLARIERDRLLRRAQLDRACAAGALSAPFDALVRESP